MFGLEKNPAMQMNLMGMFNFESIYFPWVLIGFRLLMGGLPIAEVMGVLVGHIFYFLNDLYPLQSGRRIIYTPQFLKDLFPEVGNPGDGGNVPRAANFGGGINWGQGRRLGD